MFEPIPPNYHISVISNHWLHTETHLPISFQASYPSGEIRSPLLPFLTLTCRPLLFSAQEFEAIYSKLSGRPCLHSTRVRSLALQMSGARLFTPCLRFRANVNTFGQFASGDVRRWWTSVWRSGTRNSAR